MLAVGVAAFFTLGLIQASYGPAFSFFQTHYHIALANVGLIASAHFLGSALGNPLPGFLLARFSTAQVVGWSLLLLALGAILIAFAPLWSVAVVGALLCGAGLGSTSGVLNAAYASLGTQAVNLVNAIFGIGSMVPPLLLAGLGPRGLQWPYVVVALCCVLSLLTAQFCGVPSIHVPAGTAPDRALSGRELRSVLLFALLLCLYVGLEVGFGAWSGKHLESLGIRNTALVLSGYWGGLTAGRILTGLFGGRVKPEHLILGGAGLATVCALVAALGPPQLAALAYIVAGLALGPIFGTSLAWLTHSLPARLIPFLLLSGSAGGVLMPALLGQLYVRSGPQVVPLTLACVGLLVIGAILTLNRALSQRN